MNRAATGLCAENLHVWRGECHVLKGVSLEVGPGELLHVSGPNGTGKTTLLRVMTGLLRPESGAVYWRGERVGLASAEYQRALAYASHQSALKGDLTALENLHFTVGLRRRVTIGALRDSLERTGVLHCADLPARVLSAGQQRRVAMARVLACESALWLLDEPFSNLDSAGSGLMSALLTEHITGGGLSVVVAHHDLQVSVPTRSLALAA